MRLRHFAILMLRACAVVCGSAALAPWASSQTPTGADPGDSAPYAEYQRLMAAGDLSGALSLATQIAHFEESHGADGEVLAEAYHRIGKVQLLQGDAAAARPNLQRSLEILESSVSALTSARFIEPLVDLAVCLSSLGDNGGAAVFLQRAIAIGHRTKGLFNSDQIALQELLAQNLEAVGDANGADQARRYAVLASEQQFGPDDPGILPAVIRLADWFERTGRYDMERSMFERAERIASAESGGRNPAAIRAMLGIGRSYRLQYVETPEQVENGVWGAPPRIKYDPLTGKREAIAGAIDRPGLSAGSHLNRRGLQALQRGLELLESSADPAPDLLASALIELGDWYQTDRDPDAAIAYYRRAWPILEAASSEDMPNPLRNPRPMFYRLPVELRRGQARITESGVARDAIFQVTIDERGIVGDVQRTGGDMREGQGWQIARALTRATFSPRFENGEPVATPAFVFRQMLLESPDDSETADETVGEPGSP